MGSIHKNRIHPSYISASEKFHFESEMISVYTNTPGSPVLPEWSGLIVHKTLQKTFQPLARLSVKIAELHFYTISSGRTHSSNSSSVRYPRSSAACFSVVFSAKALFAISADLSYPIFVLSAVTSIRELFRCS